jgi:hypothetical protein
MRKKQEGYSLGPSNSNSIDDNSFAIQLIPKEENNRSIESWRCYYIPKNCDSYLRKREEILYEQEWERY